MQSDRVYIIYLRSLLRHEYIYKTFVSMTITAAVYK